VSERPLRAIMLALRPRCARRITEALRSAGFAPDPLPAASIADLELFLASAPDLILASCRGKGQLVHGALRLLNERALDAPLIVVTGPRTEPLAVECVARGAADYVLSDRLTRLGLAVRAALDARAVRSRAEEERAALRRELGEQAQRIELILDAVPEGVIWVGPEGRARMANPSGQRDLQVLAGAGVGDRLVTLAGVPLADLVAQGEGAPWQELSAGERVFEVIARPVQSGAKEDGWVLVVRDMTRDRQVQQHAQQQERLAVLGRLAGGIAHDFNNILTTIAGYTELLLDDLPPSSEAREDAQEVMNAARHATSLTRQLLAFGGRQRLRPQPLDLNALIERVRGMLRPIIGETIDLDVRLAPGLDMVCADPGQIEQVVINMAVNARDAISGRGRLSISTRNVTLNRTEAEDHAPLAAGRYVELSIRDTGQGMSPEVCVRIFEPFFSTKDRGAGLGLATAYGIVAQSGGSIEVESEPGVGTVFRVYLPHAQGPGRNCTRAAPQPQAGALQQGEEWVLLVEDDANVRGIAMRLLQAQGYHVLEAGHPSAALDICRMVEGPIDLLISDVVMPDMDGRDLARAITEMRPGIRVMYMSGYAQAALAEHGVLEPGALLLPKPFTGQAMMRMVRQALDRA